MMSVFLSNSHKKIRIGYHRCNANGQAGGIARYVTRITKSADKANLEFINCAASKICSMPFLNRLFIILSLFLGLNIRKKRIDVYWGPAHKLPLFRAKGISYVVTIHDLVWKTCPQTMPLRRRLTERFFFPIALRNADAILAVSQSTANDLIKYFPFCTTKVKVIPLAGTLSECREMTPPSLSNQKYILFVGTIEPRKNIKNMLKAYALLPDALKNEYKFFLVGHSGWGDIKLDAMIAEFNLTECVEWKSTVSDQELLELYQNAYCLFFPSLYEGFGLPILEAQQFGIPVITSNISSMPEVVGEGGLLVDPNSVNSIKDVLESLLANVGLRNSLSQKAKINSQKFSWEKTIQTTCSAFFDSRYLGD